MRAPVHYAWVIVASSFLVVLGVLGLARFAFGMVLPGLAADLGLDYREQGVLGASYFAGYLAVVAAMPWLSPRLGLKRLCVAGLAVVAMGLAVMVFSTDLRVLSASYFVVGLGSGAAFVAAMSLPSRWFYSSHRARGAGVALAGAGLGILISGFLVPQVTSVGGLAPWRVIWLGFAISNLVVALIAAWLLRDTPADVGLEPYGNAGALDQSPAKRRALRLSELDWPLLLQLGVIYASFGAAGLTYTTFIVTTMIDGYAVSPARAGMMWSTVGALSIFSGPLFGYVSDRLGRRIGMSSVLSLQATAYAVVASDMGMAGLYLSITLFGLTAWSMPSIVAAAAGDYFGVENATASFAILTLLYAVGQVVGPAGAGFIAEHSGGFAMTYGIAAGLTVAAVVLCGLLKPPRARVP